MCDVMLNHWMQLSPFAYPSTPGYPARAVKVLQLDISSWSYVLTACPMMDWMFTSGDVVQFAGPSNSQSDSFGAIVVCGTPPDVYGHGLKSDAGVVPCVCTVYVFPSTQVQKDPTP